MSPSAKNRRLIATAAATAALCMAPACVSTPKPAPPLPAEPCPEGSEETHALLRLHLGATVEVWLAGYVEVEEGDWKTYPPIFMKSGPTTAHPKVRTSGPTEELPQIPKRTIFRGQLYTRENRVYGRFTEIILPGQKPMPVCMELKTGSKILGIYTVGGTRDNPEASPIQTLKTVRELDPIPSR
jgi:serine/threonine-protein kinase